MRKFFKRKDGEEKPKVAVYERSIIGKEEKAGKKSAFNKKLFIYIGFAIVLLATIAAATIFYFKYQEALGKSPSGQAAAGSVEEAKQLVETVSKIVELPKDEVPTIATVSDVEKLSDQLFFTKAQNGDKVLIYNDAKVAYLFRPSSGKIINIGPVNLATGSEIQETPAPQATEEEQAPPKVIILNGTSKTGLTRQAETKLDDAGIQAEIVDRDNAESNQYEETVVVLLAQEYKDVANVIASSFNGSVVNKVPDGESAPKNADILVILGESF